MFTLKINRFTDVLITKEFEKTIRTTEIIFGKSNQEINFSFTKIKSLQFINKDIPLIYKKSAAV